MQGCQRKLPWPFWPFDLVASSILPEKQLYTTTFQQQSSKPSLCNLVRTFPHLIHDFSHGSFLRPWRTIRYRSSIAKKRLMPCICMLSLCIYAKQLQCGQGRKIYRSAVSLCLKVRFHIAYRLRYFQQTDKKVVQVDVDAIEIFGYIY